jgi:hypothetical protein
MECTTSPDLELDRVQVSLSTARRNTRGAAVALAPSTGAGVEPWNTPMGYVCEAPAVMMSLSTEMVLADGDDLVRHGIWWPR